MHIATDFKLTHITTMFSYWVPPEVDPEDQTQGEEEELEDDIQCIVYFWRVSTNF